MNVFQAFVLGIVQGLAEFIPISSSGHLIIVPWLFGWADPGLSFDVALHAGTLLAVLAFFWRDWIELLKAFVASLARRKISGYPDRRLAWIVILATIPGAIAGGLGEKSVENLFHTSGNERTGVLLIAAFTVVLAVILWLAEWAARHVRTLKDMTARDGVVIGLAQMLALIPGVSRSGSTITAGLFSGLTREAAARFSFLLATPIVAGAAAKALYDLLKVGLPSPERLPFVVGFLTAAIVGYLCIALFLRYLQKGTLVPFVFYRFGFAALIVGVVLVRR